MEFDTKENLKSLFNNNELSKENLIKKLNKIDEIYCFNNEYLNNIQNLSFETYLSDTNRLKKDYPDEPDFKPVHGENFPAFVDPRMKPEMKYPTLLEFDSVEIIWFLVMSPLIFVFCTFTFKITNLNLKGIIDLSLLSIFIFKVCFYAIKLFKSYIKYKKDLANFEKGYNDVLENYNIQKNYYLKNLSIYKTYEKEKTDIDEYNKTLLSNEEYKNEYKQYLKEQKGRYDLYQDSEILSLMKSFLHEEYWQYCEDITKIIETGRGESIKEAINIFISDLNAKKLLEEQQRKNDILLEGMAKQREIQEQAYADQMKYYNEALRHNSALESAMGDVIQQAKINAQQAEWNARQAKINTKQAERNARQAEINAKQAKK